MYTLVFHIYCRLVLIYTLVWYIYCNLVLMCTLVWYIYCSLVLMCTLVLYIYCSLVLIFTLVWYIYCSLVLIGLWRRQFKLNLSLSIKQSRMDGGAARVFNFTSFNTMNYFTFFYILCFFCVIQNIFDFIQSIVAFFCYSFNKDKYDLESNLCF